MIDRAGPHRRRAARAGRRGVHANAKSGRCCETAPRCSRCWRSWLLPAARRGAGLPADDARRHRGRGDVPRLRHAARPRHRGAAGPARARVHPAADRPLQVEGRGEEALVAEFGESVLALPGDEGTTTSATCSCTWFPRSASCSPPAASPSPSCAGGAAAGRPRGRRRRRLAGADGSPARRRPGALRPVIAAGLRRRHRVRRLRGRLHLVRLALRAAARARLPVHDLRRLLRRHPGGPRQRRRCSARRCSSASPSRRCSSRSA